jgi:hypothetical protein
MRTGSTSRLYVRRLEQLEATPVEGSDGAILPLFAPDGRYLAFVRNGALFRAALTGGAPTRIADGVDNPRGIDWCGDEIVFNRDVSSGLFKVSTQGGPAKSLTSLDLKRREKSHRFPHVLPGCGDVLFTIGTSTTESWDDGDLAIASMETGQYRTVLPGGVHPRYSPSGHIVYNRGGTLYVGRVRPGSARGHGPARPSGLGSDERTVRRLFGIRTGAEDGGSPADADRSPRRRGAVPGDTAGVRQLPAVA